MNFAEYVKPDVSYSIPTNNGELIVSAEYDVIHSFKPLGAAILKYYDPKSSKILNLILEQPGVDFLMQQCGIGTIERDFIGVSEHEALLAYRASELTDDAL